MLDLFCGRWGWSRAFAARGWECVGIDLTVPPEIPHGCTFIQRDILTMTAEDVQGFDFICASSPCEQFSIHGMRHFHPNPKYPELGLALFNHTRMLCEASGAAYVMENVRSAQKFVGNAVNHCGPFYLWGNSVPPLMPQGITKGNRQGSGGCAKKLKGQELKDYRKNYEALQVGSKSKARAEMTAKWATIPQELTSCVADYAERITQSRAVA